jgi:uncharacterized membrane protein YccC
MASAVKATELRNEPRLVFTSAGDMQFAMRTTLAGTAALFTAMWLQLDVPRWAMWTVFIVSPPVRGNALRKTAARLVGTVIGCIVALVCVALFPQDRVGFYAVLSAWLGACAYWATLRRGYVSYAASLAAFTAAIVSAGVSAAPLNVWQAATDRGSATVLGILFALVASDIAARSDDVPGELAGRIRILAADLLDWAVKQLKPGNPDGPMDAPFTKRILGLDETCTNAVAERPALSRVKPWIRGLPTALLSLQSAVLSMRDAASRGAPATASAVSATDVFQGVADFLRSNAGMDSVSLRQHITSLARLPHDSWGQIPAWKEIVGALLYLLAGLESILTLSPPDTASPLYPLPKLVAHPRYATTNLIRTIVAMAVGFMIWDVTAWTHGVVFMVNIAVAAVVFVLLEDPVIATGATIIGTTLGGVVGLAAKYLLLISANDPLTLVLVLFPLLFIGAWIETKGKLAPFGVFFVIGLLVLIEPKNPQEYGFVNDVNTLVAIEFAYAFAALVFLVIGAPRKGEERIAELLVRMRQHRRMAPAGSTRQQLLRWETQMYDEFQRLQAVTHDPRRREYGVKLLLSGLRAGETTAPAAAELALN